MSGIKVGGVWRTPGNSFVKVAGVWRTVASVQNKVGGAWQMTTLGAPPPQPTLTHVAKGVYEVSNTDTQLTYSATLVSGSGSAIQSTVGGKVRYTLTAEDAAFGISAAWAPGATASTETNVERKKYTYTNQPYQTCTDNCQAGGGPGGEGDCWCGSRQGDLCCGGCYGQTCTWHDNYVKNGTPSGFVDEFGEWSKIWSS